MMRANRKLPRGVKLELEFLENREAPTVSPWTTLSFEGSQAGSVPLNWSQYSSDGSKTNEFSVTSKNSSTNPQPALSGNQSLTVTDPNASGDEARAWLNQTMPADVQVSAAVYVNSAIPAQVLARGRDLDGSGSGANFYAAQISTASPGLLLSLVKEVNGGTPTVLASINAPNWVSGAWLEETLDVEGSTVRAQLFNPTTDEYLNSAGQWQSSPAWALTVIDNTISGPGFVGVGRKASYTGTVNFDDFSVQTPATDQSFDATPAGQPLPENWSAYATNSNDVVAVTPPASPIAPNSGPNVLGTTAAASGDQGRAWLNTSLPADLSVSAYAYITATPAQVFARGSNLNSSAPSYYAVEVSEGGVFRLVKVVNGTPTVLYSVTSKQYIDSMWVQETLGLSGNTLYAQLYRPDTHQYMDGNGNWQSAPVWVYSMTDTSITGGGQAGVGRPVGQPEYVGTNYFDDFTAATGMDAQDFDALTALPSGWQQSSSNQFSVIAAPTSISSPVSAPNVLESTADSAASQVWDANEELTNAQVSAGMYLPSTGAQVITRGTSLGTSTPSYYGLSVSPTVTGLKVDLVRVNNGGTPTSLAELAPLPNYPTPYFSGNWVQATLYVDGANLRAQVYRPDTGEYLNSEDQWQIDPTYALNVTDTSSQAISGAGFAGLARASGSGPTLYFDNFAVTPISVDSTPPSVTVSAPSGTQTGTVTITATPTEPVPNYSIAKVEFYVDDGGNPILNWVATAAPYTWNFDTSSVSPGTHTLLVMAYDNEGNIGTATTTITTSSNTTLTMPSNFPPHQNPVGIAELSYATNNFNSQLLQSYVDVVVNNEDGNDPATMHSLGPSVQQLFYTNVSNIYLDELTNWLNYAEKNGINAEDAFYHVAIATPLFGRQHPFDAPGR